MLCGARAGLQRWDRKARCRSRADVHLRLVPAGGEPALASAYLGCLPALYSINTFWTFPVGRPGLSHEFHRDEDDYRFMVVFIYWTPVEPGEGEFYFIEGTHDPEAVAQRLREVGRLAR